MSEKSCFIIMPISDTDGYESGHFNRVYEYIIKPAVIQAGFEPIRADNIKKTNYIMIDILKRLIESDMALCDLSSKNPNVLYELGIRQAFDKPVTLIKDNLTDRVFDIQGFRDFEYDSSLRIDSVEKERDKLSEIIMNTYNNENKDVNSIIDLLSIQKAAIGSSVNISPELSFILKAIENLDEKVSRVRNNTEEIVKTDIDFKKLGIEIADYSKLEVGDSVIHRKFGNGEIIEISGIYPNSKATVDFVNFGQKQLLLKFAYLGKLPN